MSEIALQAVELVRRIEGDVAHTLVNGIDLSVKKGEFAVTGRSDRASHRCSTCWVCSMRPAKAKSSSAASRHETVGNGTG